jgi:hypothetical protein
LRTPVISDAWTPDHAVRLDRRAVAQRHVPGPDLGDLDAEVRAAVSTMASAANELPSRVVTVRVAGSIVVTSPSLTSTFSSPRNSLRSEYAMSLAATCAVATWYSSGWNWW